MGYEFASTLASLSQGQFNNAEDTETQSRNFRCATSESGSGAEFRLERLIRTGNDRLRHIHGSHDWCLSRRRRGTPAARPGCLFISGFDCES
jgi:hypothetical protein